MSLRKSPTRTPALLAALRQNAQKSTGPRTPGGKAHSYLNALRSGSRSRVRWENIEVLLSLQPRYFETWALAILHSDMGRHRIPRQDLQTAIWAQYTAMGEIRNEELRRELKQFRGTFLKRSKQECL